MNVFRPAITLLFVFVVLTGFLFPLLVWGTGQALFPHQANGSLIRSADGKPMGSELIGQNFTYPKYFHPRPSAAGSGYDAANSSGTNLGPTSDKLIKEIQDLAAAYREENGLASDAKLPADSVTRSGSGLDPHISVENAMLQAERVAKQRGSTLQQIQALIGRIQEERFFGIYGEPRVNVVKLNRALDAGPSQKEMAEF